MPSSASPCRASSSAGNASEVQFRLDSNYPVGASLHQKIIVVDDAIAFSGGWISPSGAGTHQRTLPSIQIVVDHRGVPYPPFMTSSFWWMAQPREPWPISCVSAGFAGPDSASHPRQATLTPGLAWYSPI